MSVPVTPLEKSHIVSTPEVRGGKPRINGTRICVQDIYQWHELEGKSPDQIVDEFPHLTMADVYAALAFFWDHRDQIIADLKRQVVRRFIRILRVDNLSARDRNGHGSNALTFALFPPRV